jgi:hypothetical protein
VTPLDNVQALTGANLTTFLLVLVALAGLFILFSNVIEAARKLRKPQERQADELVHHQEACEKRFAADKRTIDLHGERIDDLEVGQRVICAALHELLEHELHNGNGDAMRKASSDLFAYLNRR